VNRLLKKRKKKITKLQMFLYALLFLVVAGAWSFKFMIMDNDKPVATSENAVQKQIIIPDGSSSSKIASILKTSNLIRSEWAFKSYLKDTQIDRKLRPGTFELSNDMTFEQIADELTHGGKKKATKRFTIPEGYELSEIVELLTQKGFVDRDEFLKLVNNPEHLKEDYDFLEYIPEGHDLEGYLYPNTYDVYVDASTEDVLRKMLDGFQEIYSEILKDKIEAGGNLNDFITMASIVEREGKLDKERAKIASVFYNRIEQNMKFESCATIQYILRERKTRLLNSDLKVESPYNTYQHLGLPPGPIASPGRASIEAAINPEKTEYLFFVVNPEGESGSHNFAKTYKEFLKYKNIYKDSLQ
jgi:UPF0755 protein